MKNRKAYFSLILISCFLIAKASAQLNNDLVVFCNDGHKFTLILNGQKYNNEPQNRVKASSLNLKVYEARVIFENSRLKDINTTITFHNNGYECVFGLDALSKKKYHFVYVSSTEINPAPVTPTTTATNENTTSQPMESQYDNYSNTPTNTYNSNSTYTPTPTNSNTNSISLNTGKVNIGIGEKGKINVGTQSTNVNLDTKNPSGNIAITEGGKTIALNKAAKTGCTNPMNTLQFEAVKKNITSDTTNAGKLTKAKSSLTNCFTTAQVKEIMVLFSDDETKLDFGKHAYEHTNDLNNYTELKSTFTADAKKEEFVKFVRSMR